MRNLVAFYQTKSQAEAVRDELINAGFSRGDIKLQSPSSSGQEEKGFWESIKEAFGYAEEEDRHLYAEASRRGAYSVSLQIDNDDQPTLQTRAEEIMRRHNPVNLEEQAAKWRSEGWSGRYAQQPSTAATTQATASQATRRETRRTEGEEVIPVVQEELQVGKRQVQQGGVRIHSRVTERPVEEKVNLREEHVNVERRPVNRPVTSADVAFKERAIEATETSEQAVINKQARVVEEVALNKQVQERTETVRDTVRRTDVDVEQIPGRTGKQEEWTEQFASTLCEDQRYRGRDWNAIEPDARTNFEQRYPGRKWDEFKDQIRRGYDKIRGKSRA